MLLPNSRLRMPRNVIGTGSRATVENQLPSKNPRATSRQVVPREARNRVPRVGFRPRPNQEGPAAVATAMVAKRTRVEFRSKAIASARERARSAFVWTVERRPVTPLAATRPKRAPLKGGAAARLAAVKRPQMAVRLLSATSIRDKSNRCRGDDSLSLAHHARTGAHRRRKIRHVEGDDEHAYAPAESTGRTNIRQ